jgi:hypothetical protein
VRFKEIFDTAPDHATVIDAQATLHPLRELLNVYHLTQLAA